ncbi:MAG TPA: zf-HC2 domain-containing protein [Pyrinomonadaceae bacterium]|nr:zf-HC2 domain-containing protein [Pyrinomonadaceae bacterium]
MNNCEDICRRLNLYLDNELQGDDRAAVESHLAQCQSCATVFERELSFINAIRECGPLHVASPELRARVQETLNGAKRESSPSQRPVSRPRVRLGLAIAATLLMLILPIVVWRVMKRSSEQTPSSFALMAAENHLRRTRGQLPLEIESETPQRISEWFANKVNFRVQLPNYQESSGQEKLYTLEGARLVGYKDDYAAYVAYEMKSRPISLVITSDSLVTPTGGEQIIARGLTFHYNAIHGLKVLTWSDRGLTYALVSDLEERGQQSCIVCHQGTKDQDLIEPLKPR